MKKLVIIILLSFISNILLTMVYPNVFSHFVTYYLKFDFPVLFQIIVCFIAIVLLTSYLFFEVSKISFLNALIKSSLMYFLFIVVAILISVVSGFLAEIIYAIFKSWKSLDEIKTIIDIVTRFITVLILPLFIIAFWRISNSKNDSIKEMFDDLIPLPVMYLKIFGILMCFYVVGIMIDYIPVSPFGNIVRIILLTTIGTAGLYVTEKVCMEKILIKEPETT